MHMKCDLLMVAIFSRPQYDEQYSSVSLMAMRVEVETG